MLSRAPAVALFTTVPFSLTTDALSEVGGKSASAQKLHDSYIGFRDTVATWSRISPQADLEARAG